MSPERTSSPTRRGAPAQSHPAAHEDRAAHDYEKQCTGPSGEGEDDESDLGPVPHRDKWSTPCSAAVKSQKRDSVGPRSRHTPKISVLAECVGGCRVSSIGGPALVRPTKACATRQPPIRPGGLRRRRPRSGTSARVGGAPGSELIPRRAMLQRFRLRGGTTTREGGRCSYVSAGHLLLVVRDVEAALSVLRRGVRLRRPAPTAVPVARCGCRSRSNGAG